MQVSAKLIIIDIKYNLCYHWDISFPTITGDTVSIEENAPTDFTLEDEQEMNRYIKRSASYGTKDRSGVHFIIGLLIVTAIAVVLYAVHDYISGLTREKGEGVFSLTHDLATFPRGNDWIVAGIAITIVIYFLIRLLTRLLISFAGIMVAIDDKETGAVIWYAIMFLIKIGILTGLLVAIVYFW